MSLPAGSRLGRYHIIDLLGAGGMGMVYRAHDDRLQRDVAVKVLPPSVLTDEGARRRFRKEALALAKVSHPNIAAVYDVGEEGDTAYLVMECVPGQSLSAYAQRGPVPLADALRFAVQIAEALVEAHEHGVVHRDLKPANVMITPRGQVKVLDFGLAKLLAPRDGDNATQSRTEIGAPAGTPLYMSPEQAFGESVDGRTDLWSLGVVLYELLAGRAPFSGATDWALLQAVSQQTPPSLSTLNAALPPDVEQIVARAMSKDANSRFQTATEMRDALAESLARISAPAAVYPDVAVPGMRRVLVSVLATLIVAAAAGAWYLTGVAHRRWAREDALATIVRLTNNDMPLAATTLLDRARRYLPADTGLAHFAATSMRRVSVESSPSGVPVAIQDYLTPDSAWHSLGTTPIRDVAIPKGYFRWRLAAAGANAVIVAPPVTGSMHFALDSMAAAAPGMVRVGPQSFYNDFAFIGWVGPYQFPAFDIDRNEVTNAEYQQFVDSGGYSKQKYWTEPFVDQGRTLNWEEGVARLRDATGRPGPAAWSGGHFAAGQEQYPVSGVSWYEAAAYLAFRGKVLPAMAQWHVAGQTHLSSYIARMSNMSHDHVQPVGSAHGVGPYGTNDMAGNVREWVLNATATQQRLILGGA